MKKPGNILCEKTYPSNSTKVIHVNGTNHWPHDTAYIKCPLGHYTHQFLACDVQSFCWYHGQPLGCESPAEHLPSFTCTDQTDHVPYTLVCDHRADCSDGSDEDFCILPTCPSGQYTCNSGECLPRIKDCDGWRDCYSGDDEIQCQDYITVRRVVPPVRVNLSPNGRLSTTQRTEKTCPHTHMQCLHNENCLPVLLRCNGAYDCPGHEDERDCDLCPGFYRCRASQVCLVHNYICDGHAHCPQHDDELICDLTCPAFCVCKGLAFFCRHNFTASLYSHRFLDASGSNMTPSDLAGSMMLIHLTLTNCSLTHLEGFAHPNLLIFHAEYNRLSSIRSVDLIGVPQLRELFIAGNPLKSVFEHSENMFTSNDIQSLDLSRVVQRVLNVSAFSVFPRLQFLNLSQSGVERVLRDGFSILENLRVIDLRGCPMTSFPRGLFKSLGHMQTVYAPNFKVCCPEILPQGFNAHKCISQPDEISSCNDLLRKKEYTICVFVVSLVTMVGNIVNFIFRSCFSRKRNKSGYGNFVTHLSVSDFLMGVYFAIIGAADHVYRGAYLWNDVAWRHSFVCKFAGVVSMLSNEVSIFIMFLITFDRFLAHCAPFTRLKFSSASAHTASGAVWILGVLLVSVPLLPMTSHWEFYSQTSICIPLPATRVDFPGHDYFFSTVIVVNVVLFLVISVGQLSVYWSVRANSVFALNSTMNSTDFTVTRRLFTVIMTDFTCWFPIGVLGLLASKGFLVSNEVNVISAIFVLPLKSAVNPCMYTASVIVERRSRAREDKLRKLLITQINSTKNETMGMKL